MSTTSTEYLTTITNNELESYPFDDNGKAAFYKLIFTKYCNDNNIEPNWDKCERFCATKITVAKNIVDYWQETMMNDDPTMDMLKFSQTMCILGPKWDDSLSDNQVLLEPDCIVFA